MCGRFAFYSPHEAVVRLFGLAEDTPEVAPGYNIAPTTYVAAVRVALTPTLSHGVGEGAGTLSQGEREQDRAATRRLAMLYWGLVPAWAKEKSIGSRMINARAETLREKPAFRQAYRHRRALVPADGYYEWQALGPRDKQPWFIRPASGAPFAFGALWERWKDPASGEPLESLCLITTAATRGLAHIHDRMPVIVPPQAHAEWLDPQNGDCDSLDRLLHPDSAGPFVAHRVDRRVGNVRNQGPGLVEPQPDDGLPFGA